MPPVFSAAAPVVLTGFFVSSNGYQEIYLNPNPRSTAARVNVQPLLRPLAVALLLTSTLLTACGGGGKGGQTASADAKTPQMRCAQ